MSRRIRRVGVLRGLIVALVACSLAGEDAIRKPLRVLLVTGCDVPAHDWRATTPVTRHILEESGEFAVFVSEEIGLLESSDLARYDLIVLNCRDQPGAPLSAPARRNLASFVRDGKGLVALHFAVNAFRDWPEYAGLIGRVWKGQRQGGSSGHGPRGPFDVAVRVAEHPAAKGLEKFTIDDELYSNLEGEAPIRVVAEAYSDFSKRVEPVAWTLEPDAGRVFVTTLGHDDEARKSRGFRELLVRGCRWAGGEE